MTAPDIRVGDFIRAYAHTGAQLGERALRCNQVVEVLAVSALPGRPGATYVAGRVGRCDLTTSWLAKHISLYLSGAERSILNLAGQWQMLRRADDTTGTPRA